MVFARPYNRRVDVYVNVKLNADEASNVQRHA
ncbi:MAG: hypothetical protein JWQ11_713, partial [Rhizobacter sp.]|nr:hypothetical protein [Rhizobacter sp.]